MKENLNIKFIIIFYSIITALLVFMLFLNLKILNNSLNNSGKNYVDNVNTSGSIITEIEYKNIVNQINQNLLSKNNPNPRKVISIINNNIARVPSKVYANELVISYLSSLTKYSVYLSDYLNANSELVIHAAKDFNLANKEPVNTDDVMLNLMINEIYTYPYSIIIDNNNVYLNLDYIEIGQKYKKYISSNMYNYFEVFGNEYKKNMFDYDTGNLNINALIDRLEILDKGLNQAEVNNDSAVVMFKLAYGDTLTHISGLSHTGFQDGINESTGYPKMKDSIKKIIESHINTTKSERIKNDLSTILDALLAGQNSYNEDCTDILYSLCNFYDYQYSEIYMDKTKLFNINDFNKFKSNPDKAIKEIYDLYSDKKYDNIGKLLNESILFRYESEYKYKTNEENVNISSTDKKEFDALSEVNKILNNRTN